MNYIESINRSVEFMEKNLCSPIRIDDIASVARYSKYHFQRLFSVVTGDTVGSYLRKRRLTEAARQLIESERTIIDIALDFQFQSQESFSRSFKEQFGQTPHQYRRQKNNGIAGKKNRLESRVLDHLSSGISREPDFITRDIIPLVGFPYYGHNQEEVREIWQNLLKRSDEIEDIVKPCRAYGLVYYGESFFKNRDINYLAAYELRTDLVPVFSQIPLEFCLKALPAAKYAVFTHQGAVEKIPHSYEYIYGTWFSQSEFGPAALYDFEFYDHPIDPGDPDSIEFKIHIPIDLL